MKNKEIPGIIMVVIAGVLWGTTGTFVRTFSALGLSSLQISVFKVVIAAIILFLYTVIFKRDMLKIRLKDIWIFIAAGIISLDFLQFAISQPYRIHRSLLLPYCYIPHRPLLCLCL